MIYHPQLLPEERAQVAELAIQDEFQKKVADERRQYNRRLDLAGSEHRQRLDELRRRHAIKQNDARRAIYEQ